MSYCIIFILYYIISYCIIFLYFIISFYMVLYYFILYYIISYHIILYYIIIYYSSCCIIIFILHTCMTGFKSPTYDIWVWYLNEHGGWYTPISFQFLMANTCWSQSWHSIFRETHRSPCRRGIVNSWSMTSSATPSSWWPMNAAWNPLLRAADPQGDNQQLPVGATHWVPNHTIGPWTLGFVAISRRILYVYSLDMFWSFWISLVLVSKRWKRTFSVVSNFKARFSSIVALKRQFLKSALLTNWLDDQLHYNSSCGKEDVCWGKEYHCLRGLRWTPFERGSRLVDTKGCWWCAT